MIRLANRPHLAAGWLQNLYDKSALEAIRNVPGKGRPPKPKPEGQG